MSDLYMYSIYREGIKPDAIFIFERGMWKDDYAYVVVNGTFYEMCYEGVLRPVEPNSMLWDIKIMARDWFYIKPSTDPDIHYEIYRDRGIYDKYKVADSYDYSMNPYTCKCAPGEYVVKSFVASFCH